VDLTDLAALLSVYGTSRALDGGGP
jgi:hypothetical protein